MTFFARPDGYLSASVVGKDRKDVTYGVWAFQRKQTLAFDYLYFTPGIMPAPMMSGLLKGYLHPIVKNVFFSL